MVKQWFALEAGGRKGLEVGWGGIYRSVTVRLGETLGTTRGQKALVKGQELRLLVDLCPVFIDCELLFPGRGRRVVERPWSEINHR